MHNFIGLLVKHASMQQLLVVKWGEERETESLELRSLKGKLQTAEGWTERLG